MSETYPWAIALQITPEQIFQWTQVLPEGTSLLLWCLENGKIAEEPYLRWAAETYQLPRVKSEFFRKPPTSLDRLRLLTHGNQIWSQHCFPIHEWDGVLFVGCDQHVPEFPSDRPVQMLLAAPSELAQLWQRIHSDLANATPLPQSSPAFPPPPPSPSASVKAATEEALPSFLTQPARETAGRPAGATLSMEDLLGHTGPEAPPADGLDLKIPDRPQEVPEGLHFKLTPEEPITDHKFDLNFSSPEGLKMNVAPPSTIVPEAALADLAKKAKQAASEALAKAGLSEQTKTSTSLASPGRGPKLEDSQSGITEKVPLPTRTNIREEPSLTVNGLLASATTDEERCDLVFAKLVPPFEKVIVFFYTQNELRPFRWSAGWVPEKNSAKKPVPLHEACIFKIVFDSLLPYHGYVVSNPMNEAFFTSWNQGQLPAHVTIVPLTMEKRLIGMILGAAPSDIDANKALHLMERMSVEFSNSYLNKKKAA